MLEGEEEIGSVHLTDFVTSHKKMLEADTILISDTSMGGVDIPAITTRLRGLTYLEVKITGPNRDLHSGIFGGTVANPANVLCKMIGDLIDKNVKITIPGFYDDVALLSNGERVAINMLPWDNDNYQNELGIDAIAGEKGYTTIERTAIRPSLDVNGIWSGYTGKGAKTVLPSYAKDKISMRLVPHQDNEKIAGLFEDYFTHIAPPGVVIEITPMHGGQPFVLSTDEIGYIAAEQALQDVYNKKPIPISSGGSIPIVAMFEKELGLKSILLGFGLQTDNIHSPNENFGITNFFKGIETIPLFYKYFTENINKSK